MASAKEIKLRLQSHVEMRMREFRDAETSSPIRRDYYADCAYGAIWAANIADAITSEQRDTFLKEIRTPARKAA